MSGKKQKIVKRFIYQGLGFPVILRNVPMVQIHDEWIVDINLEKLQSEVMFALCTKQTPLAGDEIRFIRKYFEWTMETFGKLLGVTHNAVIKWEKQEENYAKITPGIEICIRLLILENLLKKDKDFRKYSRELFLLLQNFTKLQKEQKKIHPLSFDVQEELLAM